MYLAGFLDCFASGRCEHSRSRWRHGGPESWQRGRRDQVADICSRRPYVVRLPADPNSDRRRPIGGRETRAGRSTEPAVYWRSGGVRMRTVISRSAGRSPHLVRPRPTHRRPSKVRRSPAVIHCLAVVTVSPAATSQRRTVPIARTSCLFTL